MLFAIRQTASSVRVANLIRLTVDVSAKDDAKSINAGLFVSALRIIRTAHAQAVSALLGRRTWSIVGAVLVASYIRTAGPESLEIDRHDVDYFSYSLIF